MLDFTLLSSLSLTVTGMSILFLAAACTILIYEASVNQDVLLVGATLMALGMT